MTLTEILEQVYVATNRPDLVAETLQGVKLATLFVHTSAYYFKDIVESVITTDAPTRSLQFAPKDVLGARYRSMKYVQKLSPNGDLAGFIKCITPEEIFDGYSYLKNDCYYVAGSNVNINSSTQDTRYIIGYYQFPLVGSTDATYSSWVADDFPYAIICKAAQHIYAAIGYQEQARQYNQLVVEQMHILRDNSTDTEGF